MNFDFFKQCALKKKKKKKKKNSSLSFGCAPNDIFFSICMKVSLSLFKGFFYNIMLYSSTLPFGMNLFNIYIKLSLCILHTKGVVFYINMYI